VLPKINICRSILQNEEDEAPILKGCCRNPAFPGYWDLLSHSMKELDTEIGGYGRSLFQKVSNRAEASEAYDRLVGVLAALSCPK